MITKRILAMVLALSLCLMSCSASPVATAVPPSPTPAQPMANLQIFTEEYPPVTFSKDGQATGLGTEIVQEIMRRRGATFAIQVVPWTRGYDATLSGPLTGLFATMRTEERERLFKWVGPLTQVNTSFYARKGEGRALADLEAAKSVDSIGVPREYYSHQFLRQAGFTNLDEAADPETMVKKFLAGRNPLMVIDNITLPELLQRNNAKLEEVELVYTFMTSKNYLAFSLDTPDELVQQWQMTLDEMRADGTIAKLYAKWLPGETPPGKDN